VAQRVENIDEKMILNCPKGQIAHVVKLQNRAFSNGISARFEVEFAQFVILLQGNEIAMVNVNPSQRSGE